DIHMPGESGLELLEKVKKSLPDTGFIVITASHDLTDAIASLNQGADRYLLKPLNIEELKHGVKSSLEKRRLVLETREYQKNLEEKVGMRTEELRKSLQELDGAHKNIKASYVETIYRLTITSEYRDEETGQHIRRVGQYSRLLPPAVPRRFWNRHPPMSSQAVLHLKV
ncbi:MAG: response regulator, partial [Pirellulaceae bacterium]